MDRIIARIFRKKSLALVTPDTCLKRCLTAFDLTVMGVGAMVGSGIYVMTGQVIKETAGPAIVISFLLSAVVILMVAGCFTEFAARLQKTGSTYLYVYVILGELPAFLVGFSTLCMSVMAGATNARAWSAYLDSLFSGAISNYTIITLGTLDVGRPLGPYLDIPAMTILLVITVIIILGAKCSSWFNTVFALINVAILTFVCIMGCIYGNLKNWTDPSLGGFFPFGFPGVVSGSAVCFWAYSGFEVLSCAVEESVNPKRDIPLATVISLLLVMVLYTGTSMSLTLITPYNTIDIAAPFPSAFAEQDVYWAKLIVSVGPLCGLTTTLISTVYSAVRIAYKISEDGLLFQWMSHVMAFSRVPVVSVVTFGLIMSVVAMLLDISELINFSIILILLSYVLVCACVVIMRYSPNNMMSSAVTHLKSSQEISTLLCEELVHNSDLSDHDGHSAKINSNPQHGENGSPPPISQEEEPQTVVSTSRSGMVPDTAGAGHLKDVCSCLWPCRLMVPGRWPQLATLLLCLPMIGLSVVCVHFSQAVMECAWWAVSMLVFCCITIVALIVSMYAHLQNVAGQTVKMPMVPLLPVLCMCLCIYMMVSMAEPLQWLEVIALEFGGLVVYFAYSLSHSQLNRLGRHDAASTEAGDTTALLDDHSEEEVL